MALKHRLISKNIMSIGPPVSLINLLCAELCLPGHLRKCVLYKIAGRDVPRIVHMSISMPAMYTLKLYLCTLGLGRLSGSTYYTM